jgi:hypothetical protein
MTRRKAQPRRKPSSGVRGAGGKSRPKQRAPQGRRASSRRNPIAVGAIVVVLVAVVGMVGFALVKKTPVPARSGGGANAARELQAVPGSMLSTVGSQTDVTPPTRLPSGTSALTQDGKPEVLYIGAEYCPFCAAQRWALILALSRFGSFTGLSATHSSSTDVFPNTPTFTFHGSTYTSAYLSFTGVEETTNQPDGNGGYTPLDSTTAADQTLLQRFDAAPYTDQPGAIPFLLLGNGFVAIGSGFPPSLLAGMTVDDVAAKLTDATDPVTTGIVGAANTMIAALCELTGGQPSKVCSAPFVQQIQAAFLPAP